MYWIVHSGVLVIDGSITPRAPKVVVAANLLRKVDEDLNGANIVGEGLAVPAKCSSDLYSEKITTNILIYNNSYLSTIVPDAAHHRFTMHVPQGHMLLSTVSSRRVQRLVTSSHRPISWPWVSHPDVCPLVQHDEHWRRSLGAAGAHTSWRASFQISENLINFSDAPKHLNVPNNDHHFRERFSSDAFCFSSL